MEIPVLSAVQSRILLALLTEGALVSSQILKVVGISGSSWAKEKRFLVSARLLDYRVSRELTERGVIRKLEFTLTPRGKQIAHSLLIIADSIAHTEDQKAIEKVYLTVA
ncbi:MAG: hypothetical protein ACYCQJ_02190 [Nitrososphaerales archaeon]